MVCTNIEVYLNTVKQLNKSIRGPSNRPPSPVNRRRRSVGRACRHRKINPDPTDSSSDEDYESDGSLLSDTSWLPRSPKEHPFTPEPLNVYFSSAYSFKKGLASKAIVVILKSGKNRTKMRACHLRFQSRNVRFSGGFIFGV